MEQVQMLEQWAYFTQLSVLSHPTPRPDPEKRQKGRDHGGQRRRQRGDGGFLLLGGPSAALLGHPGCPLL